MADEQFDLIAIGGGLAGLAAAGRARDLGARALVLEADPQAKHLCASRVNGGVFHLAFRSLLTDPDELEREIVLASGGFVAERLAHAMARHSVRAVQWLQAAGVEFTRMEPDDGWKDCVLAPLGFHASTKMAWRGLGADRMMDRLEAHVVARGANVLRGARATGLLLAEGRCLGVHATFEGRETTYCAPTTVLADGGFHGNLAMLKENVTPYPERLKLRGTAAGQGDGIRLAREAGAGLLAMDQIYGHLLSVDALHDDNLAAYPFLDFLATAGVIVDDRAQRFVDEGRGAHAIVNALARHRSTFATVIFDDAIWNCAGRHFFSPPNPKLVEAGGTLHRAADIASLASVAGLPAAVLVRTVADHNAALSAGTLASQSPPRSAAKKHPAKPIAIPPFYAAPACVSITHTIGGVAVDEHARVLRPDGTPIEGLYAAGTTCGGLEGGPDFAYLGGLAPAAVFGMLAAEDSERRRRPLTRGDRTHEA